MNKMKQVEVRVRDGISESFKLDQLYGVVNEDFDIHVNGSIEMIDKEYPNLERVKVYANLCNKDGLILYILNNWNNYQINAGDYHSFSLYCSTVGRFFDSSELEYVELYLSFNEKES